MSYLAVISSLLCAAGVGTFTVDADYPGGNIIVERVDGDNVYLRQDLRDTTGWWFYWNFRVQGAAGQTLSFRLTHKNVLGTRGPAVSLDGGATWSWLGLDIATETRKGVSFSYTFPPNAESVRFAFAMPYQEADLERFLQQHAGNPTTRTYGSCAPHEKDVPSSAFTSGISPVTPSTAYCSRAVTTPANPWPATPSKAPWRAFSPTRTTDSGSASTSKYSPSPSWTKTASKTATKARTAPPTTTTATTAEPACILPSPHFARWCRNGRTAASISRWTFTAPYIRGKHNEVIYLVGSQSASIWAEQSRFGQILESVQKESLPYSASNNVPFGQAWNTAKNYTAGKNFSLWAAELPGIRLATGMEIPYANVGTVTVTPARARAFGERLVQAMRRYLSED